MIWAIASLFILYFQFGVTYSAAPNTALHLHTPDLAAQNESHNVATLEKQCLAFLKAYMPAGDKDTVTDIVLEKNVRLALLARFSFPWAEEVPLDIFLNDVLPYASLDEPRDKWRALFYSKFRPIVQNAKSLSEAAQLLNKEIWDVFGIVFKPGQTPGIMAPSQTIEHGYASCTGLSIFLVDACRAVGIPARVAGVPQWNTAAGGNHDWVEIWDGSSWSFTGAHEYTSEGLNHTWFFPYPAQKQIPGDVMHSIYAASWKPTGLHFPLLWNLDYRGVHAVDRTQAYLSMEPSIVAKET